MVEEIKESLYNNVKDKISSPFWGTFIISWLIWNWRVWYVTFFVDSELLLSSRNILKIDYVSNFYHWDSFGNSFFSISLILILPLFSSYLIVFWIPKLTKYYYKKSLEFEYENKIIKSNKDKQFLDIENEKLIIKGKKLESERKVMQQEKILKQIRPEKSQEEVWDGDYVNFKQTKYFQEFKLIKESIYNERGATKWNWNNYGRYSNEISADSKAYFDVNEIIKISKVGSNEIISLTEKGKYFMKKYSEEN